jgi:hypothetical protein
MLDEPQVQTESEVDVAAVMASLEISKTQFPEVALRTVRDHPRLFIPHLIETIRAATAAARDGQKQISFVQDIALLFLTEFRAKEALPAILEAITLPGELPFDLFGELITEDLPRTLAVLADDQLELLDGLIRDRAVNEYVRWGAVDTIAMLARGGQITREQAAERLNSHLLVAFETGDEDVGIPLVSSLCRLGVASSRDLVLEAFTKLDIDRRFTTPDHVRDDFDAAAAGDLSQFERIEAPEPRDTIEYVKTWVYSREDENDDLPLGLHDDEEWSNDWEQAPEPIHAPTKVGRNEACPCGSGKKFKKCCGRSSTDTGIHLTV